MTQTKNASPAYLDGSKTSGSTTTIEREEQQLATSFARAATIDSTFSYMGSSMTFLAKSSETGGRFALMEYYTKPGSEPPPEFASEGIRFNTIAPGVVNTPMNPPEHHEFLKQLSPLKRLAEVEEVANLSLYLDSAGFVNGEVVHLDGGAPAGKW